MQLNRTTLERHGAFAISPESYDKGQRCSTIFASSGDGAGMVNMTVRATSRFVREFTANGESIGVVDIRSYCRRVASRRAKQRALSFVRKMFGVKP